MSDPQVNIYTGGCVQTNGYLVTINHDTFLIDAPEGLAGILPELDHKPTELLLTHQHFDHVEDAEKLAALGLPIAAWKPYTPSLIRDDIAQSMGLPVSVPPFTVNTLLEEKSTHSIGSTEISLLHVPGHASDSVAYHLPEHKLLFAGDTLFQRSIGRTDLPDGDHPLLIHSIKEKLFTLPDETIVFPGHGNPTTIAEEKAGNPFLQNI